jgi:hypothetical protein
VTPLVPIVMFGWIPLTIVLFNKLSPQRAVVISTVGGVLFIPMWSYALPAFAIYDKITAISVSLLCGEIFSSAKNRYPLKMTPFDIPMIVYCLFSPLLSCIANSLRLYDGLAYAFSNFLHWGVFYWIGRRYFREPAALRELTRGLLIGGLLYFPLIVYEVRMSPQLSRIVYGFFPHSFLQHIRYGGYRPIVFMQHGLMVALWMAITAMTAFWLWRSKDERKVKGVPIFFAVIALVTGTVFCKSANGIIYMSLGILLFFIYKRNGSTKLLRWAMLLIPAYIVLRLSGVLSAENVLGYIRKYFDQDRVGSLSIRLVQEDLFGMKALEQPLLGWGIISRGWPTDPRTGETLVSMVDSLWVIILSSYGLLGLGSFFTALGIGPFMVFSKFAKRQNASSLAQNTYQVDAIILGLASTFFLSDSLLNAMENPVYALCSGALITYYLRVSAPALEELPSDGLMYVSAPT